METMTKERKAFNCPTQLETETLINKQNIKQNKQGKCFISAASSTKGTR